MSGAAVLVSFPLIRMAINTLAIIGLSAATIVAAGGGLSYAAENSVPGDMLYGIKTNVNEGLLYSLNGTASERADAELKLAERRMDEARTLQTNGELTADVQADIDSQIRTHLANAGTYAISAEQEGDDADMVTDIRSRLNAATSAQGTLFLGGSAASDSSVSSDADASDDISEGTDASLDNDGDTDASVSGNADASVDAESKVKVDDDMNGSVDAEGSLNGAVNGTMNY